MKRNITIALEEEVDRWASLEAKGRDISLSRLVNEVLEEQMRRQDPFNKAMKRALSRKPFLTSDGKYLSREEAHFRR